MIDAKNMNTSPKIAIIGSGSVGGALGKNLASKGYEIVFGVRDPEAEKVRSLLNKIEGNAKAETIETAAQWGDVIILATPWSVTEAVIKSCGNLTEKIIIDCTNPLNQTFTDLTVGHTQSGGELVAEWAQGAKVFKSFNQTGWGNMENPVFATGNSVMFVCGDDPEAKTIVLKIVSDVGFETIDAGDLKISRLLEPYALLWIHLSLRQNLGRDWGFQIARRS